MFGAKQRLRLYLNQVRPWAMGLNNRGWFSEDFDSPEVKAARLDMTHTIMPLFMPNVSDFDRFLLSPDQYAALLNFEHAASNFNAILARLNSARYEGDETRYSFIRQLHVGAIGNATSSGLYTAYNDLLNSLK